MLSMYHICILLMSSALSLLPTEAQNATTAPPAPCSCDGISYDRSEEPFYVDDCIYCTNCGEITTVECPSLCVDGQNVEGQCCPTCPNGPNCRAFGEIIPAGEDRVVDGYLCRCEPYTFGGEDRQANCEPFYALPDY